MDSAMSSIPIQDYPAAMPPPGVIPNFANPQSRGPVVMAISLVCLALMWIFFTTRLFSKCWILRSFNSDDGASIAAVAFISTYIGAVNYEMNILGPHGWNVRAIRLDEHFFKISVVVTEVFYGPGIFFAKLSILLLYIRMFGRNRRLRLLSYLGIILNFAIYAATSFAFGYLCIPRPHETWLHRTTSPACSAHSRPLNYIQGIYGIVSDIYIFFLPIPVIWQLQMPKKKRVGVITIFATAIFAVVASILGLYYRVIDALGTDQIWNLPPALLVAIVEMSVGTMCGCMPYIPATFNKKDFELPGSVHKFLRRIASFPSTVWSRGAKDRLSSASPQASSTSEHDMVRLNTDALGSIDGNGRFVRASRFNDMKRSSANMELR